MAKKEKSCFLSRRWRLTQWIFWGLIAVEFALTVALLAFVGIAAPNLYRTKLQAEGASHGWNSSPTAALYAAANYRPYKTPIVWSQFLTNYSLVIVVLSMFLMLVKSVMFMLHVFPPIVSVAVHVLLSVLYTLSVAFQASPDTSDPTRPQHGAPWYITKPCSVASEEFNIGYCQQAKATFSCSVAILGIFVGYLVLSIYSCFPSAEQKAKYMERKQIQREKYGFLDEAEEEDDTRRTAAPAPVSSGALNPMTPRTLAFNTLGGTKDLPLRAQAAKNNAVQMQTRDVPKKQDAVKREQRRSLLAFNLRSPGLPRTPGRSGFTDVPLTDSRTTDVNANNSSGTNTGANPMYFPPPPKQSTTARR